MTDSGKPVDPPSRTSNRPRSLNLDEILSAADAQTREVRTRPIVVQALQRLEEVIQQGEGRNSLAFLCERGCEREELIWLLATCSWDASHERVDQITELDDRKLKAALKRFAKCAGEVEQLSHRSAVQKLLTKSGVTRPFQIPQDLRDFGALLEFISDLRAHIYWVLARNRLIRYVNSCTGQFWDKPVAELIATVSNRDNYDEKAHRQWRFRNYGRAVELQLPAGASPALRNRAKRITMWVFLVCEAWFVQ
jgi:hypothetical protein